MADVNQDGHLDILSGSYSRMGKSMAGLFQVLAGNGKGGWSKPAVLKGTDSEPLIIAASDKNVVDKICTRPTACDLDGDGDLDLVVGNFRGTFFFFEGHGKGKFAPEATPLKARDGAELKVPLHSDPFLVDWDGDGDCDLISGSGQGGVFLALNEGSAKNPVFAPMSPLVPAHGREVEGQLAFGEAHVTGPMTSTRVFAADVDGDGKLDLLIGDAFTINTPAKGLSEEDAAKQHREWTKTLQAAGEDFDYQAHYQRRDRIITQRRTGTVWLLRGR